MPERLRLTLGGVVQGVGFRPFVHRLAYDVGVGGQVCNAAGTVLIEVEGEGAALDAFAQRLLVEAPPLSRPELRGSVREAVAVARGGFAILESQSGHEADIHLPPDTHLCNDCRRELFDPADRRYRYPFINCTQCGPRYTLIAALPYDRARTTMRDFALCPACRAEYEAPANRRFHAEPVACPVCGPQLQWHMADATAECEAALQAALAALRAGSVVAVRGVGGYHLLCDARSEAAVTRLRARKARPSRPFAVLFDETGADGGDALRDFLAPTPEELRLLRSPQRPIVLLAMQSSCALAAGIAPGLAHVGAMLPYSPLHALLVRDFGGPLVATSGNLSGEPIALDPEEAETRLARIADGFLHHDRPILRPAEDSVWQLASTQALPVRLGRGEAPQEWRLARPLAVPTLALGGEQKTTVALGWGERVVVSPHIGDLEHPESIHWLARVVEDFARLYGVQPARIVLDAHPRYHGRRWAEGMGLTLAEVWHHPAHASALAAEHPQIGDWLTLAWDGVGLGPDGSLWGGEVLRGCPGRWQRVARLRPFRLPGGEAASRECWRSAAGLLWEAGLDCPPWHAQLDMLRAAWQARLNNPLTSACGRLFDAVAALLGVCLHASFEGEGPMRLQALAEQAADGPRWPVCWRREGALLELDWSAWLAPLQDDGIPVPARAWAFHDALARAVAELPAQLGLPATLPLGLTGGVFQNRLLIARIRAHWPGTLHLPQRQPANDAGLALGQLVELLARDHE